MRGKLLLILLLAPIAAAQAGEPAENAVGYANGISVVGGPVIRAPVGESTVVRVQLYNGHPTEPREIRVGIIDVAHIVPGADPGEGEGMGTRGIDDVVTVPPAGEGEWRVELLPSGDGSRWRITLGIAEDISAPLSAVTAFEVDTRRTILTDLGGLAGYAAGGALGAGVGALLVWRPEIRGLLALPFLSLYTRLRRSDALLQSKRKAIFELVCARPGLGYAELMRESGLGAGVLVHHLRILERERLVVSRRYGIHRRIFPAAHTTVEAPSNAAQERVLAELRTSPLTQRELRERLALSQQGVSYHIRNLARDGRIEEERADGERRWRAVDGT